MSSLTIPRHITKSLRRTLRSAGSSEIGGILLAEQLRADSFQLIEHTVDEQAGTSSTFRRSETQHSAAFDEFLEKYKHEFRRYNYLGEWHSHPSFPVQPSLKDRETMQSIVGGDRGLPFAVLLIVRLDYWFQLRAAATVFRRGYEPSPMDLIFEKKAQSVRSNNV